MFKNNPTVFIVLLALLILTSPSLVLAGGARGKTVRAPAIVSTATVPQVLDEKASDTPMSVPRHYTEDVIRLKREAEMAGMALASADMAGATLDPGSEALQGADSPTLEAPSILPIFAGPSCTGWYPPDPIMAVGPSHVLVMVNSSYSIYSKTGGAALYTTTLTHWFNSVAPSTMKIFNPKCVYDPWGRRYIMLALGMNTKTKESYYLVSVSQTSSAIGTWWVWKLNAGQNGSTTTGNWADYPGLGFDSTGAVFITSNQFSFGSGAFQYSKLRILKKSQLYKGTSLSWHDFWAGKNANNSTVFTWQPAQALSSTSYGWLVNTVSASSGKQLSIWKVTNPTAATPTLARAGTVAVRSYSAPPDAVQKGGTALIDTGDCRLYGAVYQNGHIYTSTAESFNYGGGATESAMRLFKLNTASNNATIDETYGGSNYFYYYPAVTVDITGNIYLVFNRSGSTEYASVRFTGRKTTDTATQSSALLKAGQAYYVHKDSTGKNRWGDYSGISRDPSGNIWMFGEYAKSSNTWGTWIERTKF